MIKIDKSRCVGCGACISVCPDGLELKDGKARIKNKKAAGLDDTIDACPMHAIN